MLSVSRLGMRNSSVLTSLTASSCTTRKDTETDGFGQNGSWREQQIRIRQIPAWKLGWLLGSNLRHTPGGANTLNDAPEPFIQPIDRKRHSSFDRYR